MPKTYKTYFQELDILIVIKYLKKTISGDIIFMKLMGYGRVSLYQAPQSG